MGVEINRLAMGPSYNTEPSTTMITSATYRRFNNADRDMEMDVLRLNHREADTDSEDEGSSSEMASTGELAGIYLGVLNVYTTLPQFVGTFISWIVFSIFEPGVSSSDVTDQAAAAAKTAQKPPQEARDAKWMNLDSDAPNAIGICLFIGALSALVAAEATRRLRYVL